MRLWRRRANDVDEEIATHISMATVDRIARGTSPEEARRAALREFGNPLLVRETTRRMWAAEWLEHILQDLRYAWRQMRRSPAFTLTVIATLALRLGATLAMVTIVENVLLQVLPYRDAHHLVTIYESGRRGDQPRVPWLDIQQWRSSSRSFESIGFYQSLMGFGKDRRAIVVGILDDTRQISVTEQSVSEIQVYFPQLTPASGTYQAAGSVAMSLVLRTIRSPSSIVPELRAIMTHASPELANTEFTTMTQIVEDAYGSQQLVSRLLIVFGGSALLLCLSGLYGLLAQLVTREIGVRIALGARRSQIVYLILRYASRLLLIGALVGLALAWLPTRLVAGFLYDVHPHDTLTVV